MRIPPNSVVEELQFRSHDEIKAAARFTHDYSTTRATALSGGREWICSAPTLVSLIRSSCQNAADRPKRP